jgi:hypothetical protein
MPRYQITVALDLDLEEGWALACDHDLPDPDDPLQQVAALLRKYDPDVIAVTALPTRLVTP